MSYCTRACSDAQRPPDLEGRSWFPVVGDLAQLLLCLGESPPRPPAPWTARTHCMAQGGPGPLALGPWERSSLTCMELGMFGPRTTWILLLRVKPPRNMIRGWKTKKIRLCTGFQKSLIFQGVAEMGIICSSPPRCTLRPPPLTDTGYEN